ncbi:MAG: CotH kinase family protein [Kiritimatiellia bacterium]
MPDVRLGGSDVSASPGGGVYAGPQTVTLTAPAGQIRYTLDGSNPSGTSALCTGPLNFTSTTVLRARCFETGKPPGPILTRTYFIGESQGTLPYVSVVAAPDTLFGSTIGIYSNLHEQISTDFGLNDVFKNKDAPGHVEFFPPAGAPGFKANCGVRVGGENNWVHPQKALNLSFRGKYGDDAVKYDIWPEGGIPIHTSIVLRDGGDRWANEMLRDCMWPKLARDHLKVETYDYRPSVVFVNGKYFGLHDLRERWDDAWFTQRYHVPPGEMDHLLYGHITSSAVTLGADKGDTTEWLDLMNFLTTSNLTVAANWAFVESRIDMESFMDFVISESYGNNIAWLHNREFWKEKKPGAKWKWFLADMDRTLSTSAVTGTLADLLANEDVLVRLKANTGFKQRLAQRYAAHMAGTFTAARVQSIMNRLDSEISATEVARHQTRWAPNGMTAATRAAGITGTLTYATTRAGNVHAEISAQLGVAAAVGHHPRPLQPPPTAPCSSKASPSTRA